VGYTEEKLVFKKDINPFISIDEEFPAKYLLAIMASRLISYLYINISSIATKDDFRQTTLSELREIPIPIANQQKKKVLIENVDEILNLKKQDNNSNTESFEKDIDRLVYELYDLNDEEISIIETA
jgi:hypothetical protein